MQSVNCERLLGEEGLRAALTVTQARPVTSPNPSAWCCPPPPFPLKILLHNAEKYSKGILSEILDFVMGTGLIPADGEVWKMRRR